MLIRSSKDFENTRNQLRFFVIRSYGKSHSILINHLCFVFLMRLKIVHTVLSMMHQFFNSWFPFWACNSLSSVVKWLKIQGNWGMSFFKPQKSHFGTFSIITGFFRRDGLVEALAGTLLDIFATGFFAMTMQMLTILKMRLKCGFWGRNQHSSFSRAYWSNSWMLIDICPDPTWFFWTFSTVCFSTFSISSCSSCYG